MIVKSKTWKYAGFSRLASYLTKHRGGEDHYDLEVFHNIHPEEDISAIVDQFRENDDYRKKRNGGVAIYHEIMSFHGEDRDYLTPETLEDLATKYLEMRAPDALAFAAVHKDRNHTHVHIMISANEYRSDKATRISKKDFANIQRDLEAYQKEHYGLEHSIAYELGRETQREPNRVSRNAVAPIVHEAFANAQDIEHFSALLEKQGYPVYTYRGKPNGVLVNGNKIWFKQLNFDPGLFDLTLEQYVEGRLSFANHLLETLRTEEGKSERQKEREQQIAQLEKRYPYLALLSENDPDRAGWINQFQKLEEERANKPINPLTLQLKIAEREERWQWVRENVMTKGERFRSDALNAGHATLAVTSEVTGAIFEGVRVSYSFLGFALFKFQQRIRQQAIKRHQEQQSQRAGTRAEALQQRLAEGTSLSREDEIHRRAEDERSANRERRAESRRPRGRDR